MTKLSAGQIASLAITAGFDNTNKNSQGATDTAIAVAVALLESGGETTAHNSTPPDDSFGLWQINMIGALGPSRRAAFGITSNEQLFDPAINAKAAHLIRSFPGGWGAWSTYSKFIKTGLAANVLQEAISAASSPSDPNITPPIHDPQPGDTITTNWLTDALKAVVSFFIDLLKPVFLRIATFIGGGVILIIGIIIYIKKVKK